MNFKKIIAASALAGALFLSLFSCGNQGDDGADNVTGGINFDYSKGLTEDGFFEGVKASDYVSLPQYKGVPVPASVLTASDEELQAQIDGILAEYTEYEKIYDREVGGDDTVNIDYVGKIDGKEFEGGNTNGKGTTVTIGVTPYIEGFLDQLVGHKPGETFDITVTFPDPYEPNEELSGKEAVFTITINYIQGDPLPVELSDEIAAEYGFSSKEELIADIKDWIVSRQKLEFFDSIMAEATCSEIPAAILDYIKNEEIAYCETMAASYGMDADEFIKLYTGYSTLDEFIDSRTDYYRDTATSFLITQAIAELEGIKVSDEDIEKYGYEDYVTTYGKPYTKLLILANVKVPQFVVESGVVTE